MPEVRFYHLTRSPLEVTLPSLLEKSLQRGWRVIVQCANAEHMKLLDERLWTAQADSFIPHGTSNDQNIADQPVLLTLDEKNGNSANVLMLVDGAQTAVKRLAEFELACVFFDGNNVAALEAARNNWKDVTSAKMQAVYWAQDNDGRWLKKAESSTE